MALPRRLKYPEERKTLTFDFSTKFNFSDDSLTGTPTVSADAGLTVGTPVIDASLKLVSARYSGGTVGNNYTTRCEVDTTKGDHLKLAAIIEISDDAN